MVEFIFDLQRFDGEGSSSGASGGGTGGSSSGGSNAKTDSDTAAAAAEIWVDDWKSYSTKVRSALATQAYSLAQVVTPTYYYATGIADTVSVSGKENNIIYGVDRLDTVKFVDQNLESFATFYNYTEYNDYVDLIFDMSPQTGPDFGSVTRLYLADENFTPVLSFASGLNVVYSFDEKTWFGSDEIEVASNFWNNYISQSGKVDDDDNAILPGEIFGASRGINNYITNVDWQDSINFYDTAFTEMTFTQKTDKGLAMTFLNGTSALVQYDGDFSPTFYFNDGTTRIYNSKMGAWRTVEEAWADAAQYAAESSQSVVDTLAFNTNFNTVYDASHTYTDANGNEITPAYTAPLLASRLTNTAIYNATLRNDVYFTDAVSANVVDVIHEDNSHFDIVFDTGAITRIEYADIVSPLLHFADGETLVYDLSIGSQSASIYPAPGEGFIPAYSGSRRPNTPAPENDTSSGGDDRSSSDSSGGDGGSSSGSSGGGVTEPVIPSIDAAVAVDVVEPDTLAVSYDDDNVEAIRNSGDDVNAGTGHNSSQTSVNPHTDDSEFDARNNDIRSAADKDNIIFEYLPEAFVVSRYSDGFINKVTAQDDILLVDTSFENISDFNITGNYDIILNFDTGKQLRVRDESIVSPVFHFADGTSAAYNWAANQWVGVMEAGDFNNGITEVFGTSAYIDNFIRNVEPVDYVYIPDATWANVANIDSNDYYVNITFDTGANTAIRYATEGQSPVIQFADGSTYRYYSAGGYELNAHTNYGATEYYATDLSVGETFYLSKETSNIVYYTGGEDTVNFFDATSTDVTKIENVDAYTIEFTFSNGTTTTIDYWEYYSPLFTFADGVSLYYDYGYGTWETLSDSATGVVDSPTGIEQSYTGTSDVDAFILNKNDNNTVSNMLKNDFVIFSNATLANIINTVVTRVDNAYEEVTFTFDNGATTKIEFERGSSSPIIQFADGTGYQYHLNYLGQGVRRNVYLGTDGADLFTLSKANSNNVINAGASDIVYISDATVQDVTYQDFSGYDSFITFGFGVSPNVKATSIYYNIDEGFTPTIVLADGTTYRYNVYDSDYKEAADTFPISRNNDSKIFRAGLNDTIAFVDATIGNVTNFDTSSLLDTSSLAGNREINLTFDTGKTAGIELRGYNNPSPLLDFTDGFLVYDNRSASWVNPIIATDAAETFSFSKANDNFVYYTDANDTIVISDAARGDLRHEWGYGSFYTLESVTNGSDINFDDGMISLVFDTGTATYIGYNNAGESTPTIVLTNDTIKYNIYTATDGVDTFTLSRNNDNVIRPYSQPEDVIVFADATPSNVTSVEALNYDTLIFTFDTGTTTNIQYDLYYYENEYAFYDYYGSDKSKIGLSPIFTFADGSIYRYLNGNNSIDKGWQKWDASTETWQDSGSNFVVSADIASDGLWGDTFSGTAAADDIFVGTVGNTLVQNVDAQDSVTFGATLSDIVATSVSDNTIAIAFGTGATAVIETAGTSPTFNLASGESYIYDKQSASWKTA